MFSGLVCLETILPPEKHENQRPEEPPLQEAEQRKSLLDTQDSWVRH